VSLSELRAVAKMSPRLWNCDDSVTKGGFGWESAS